MKVFEVFQREHYTENYQNGTERVVLTDWEQKFRHIVSNKDYDSFKNISEEEFQQRIDKRLERISDDILRAQKDFPRHEYCLVSYDLPD